jgi:hypothetical protein
MAGNLRENSKVFRLKILNPLKPANNLNEKIKFQILL